MRHMMKPPRKFLRLAFDGVVPAAGFLIASAMAGTTAGAATAVLCAVLLVAYRLLRGHQVRTVTASLGFTLVHAALAQITGESKNFFLPGLLVNGILATAFVGSLLIRRPATGTIACWVELEGRHWRDAPERLALHLRLTSWWLAVWCLHLLMWLPLYAADAVVALGVAEFAGKAIMVLCLFLTWRMLRTHAASLPVPASPSPQHAAVRERRS